ncbi:hypothetical protein [Streptomyces sp. NBC_01198]|uniref:hypothetical protein n=1 Tax=Streptomyces sp. NBC_01198 TaxID=2903769 RepID=UPI002E0D1CC3|nr:hypothetical protein OG702_02310 [Streptomyces sp. NBC_01198]
MPDYLPPGKFDPRPPRGGRGRRERSVWTAIGSLLAIVLALTGLVVVGAMVMLAVGMNTMGSNK